jgi:hypothetical protein
MAYRHAQGSDVASTSFHGAAAAAQSVAPALLKASLLFKEDQGPVGRPCSQVPQGTIAPPEQSPIVSVPALSCDQHYLHRTALPAQEPPAPVAAHSAQHSARIRTLGPTASAPFRAACLCRRRAGACNIPGSMAPPAHCLMASSHRVPPPAQHGPAGAESQGQRHSGQHASADAEPHGQRRLLLRLLLLLGQQRLDLLLKLQLRQGKEMMSRQQEVFCKWQECCRGNKEVIFEQGGFQTFNEEACAAGGARRGREARQARGE